MRRLLMISPHFPPDSTAATHRVRLLAPRMADFGWQPTVLTVDPRDYEGRLDPGLFASIPPGLRIVRTRAWPAAVSRAIGVGDLGLRAFRGLWKGATDLFAADPFDAVFVTIYPAYTALLGPLLKRRFKCAFVLDYQDPWVGEWGRSAGPRVDGRPDFKSRISRFLACRLEPRALEAADAVTAVSHATYEQALERTPTAKPRACAELPIGWDPRDLEFAAGARTFSDEGLLHLSYVGTLLPTGLETLRAVLAAVAALRAGKPAAARLRLHFYGTSNQRIASAPPRVLPVAAEYGLSDVVTEHPARLDYFDALRVLRDSSGVLLMGSHERHYTPSKVYPALLARRPVIGVLHSASSAVDLLQRIGRPPSVRLITYEDGPLRAGQDALVSALSSFVDNPCYDAGVMSEQLLEPVSARSLAGRLAGVLDRCLP